VDYEKEMFMNCFNKTESEYIVGETSKQLISMHEALGATKSEIEIEGAYKGCLFKVCLQWYNVTGNTVMDLFIKGHSSHNLIDELLMLFGDLGGEKVFIKFTTYLNKLDKILDNGFENLMYYIEFYRLIDFCSVIEN